MRYNLPPVDIEPSKCLLLSRIIFEFYLCHFPLLYSDAIKVTDKNLRFIAKMEIIKSLKYLGIIQNTRLE